MFEFFDTRNPEKDKIIPFGHELSYREKSSLQGYKAVLSSPPTRPPPPQKKKKKKNKLCMNFE